MKDKKNPSDEYLRDLVRGLDRKQYALREAASYGEMMINTGYLEVEISELRDRIESRCLILLLGALQSDNLMEIQDFFLIVQDASKRHRSFDSVLALDAVPFAEQVFAGLFKYLVRNVIAEVDDDAKQQLFDKLKVFDEDSKE
ncbi:hypothetical protein ACFL10_00225 [Patescibacteria group bacterium]